MYNGIQKIENVIDYIETHLLEELSHNEMAMRMNLSVYEFRRIFSFIVGCPVSEYIRRRRLSLAATEIMTNNTVNLQKISEKYGYSNQSSFTRAFYEQHGVSPSLCIHDKPQINLFTQPRFSVSIFGRENIPFKIINSDAFFISGFSGVSSVSDTCCCENVWNAFYESDSDKKIVGDKIYVSYQNHGNNVKCCIGEKSTEGQKIPASKWACFELCTVDDDAVNEKYSKIIYEYLPSANLKRKDNFPTVEVYPFDMSENNFNWEIRIPIE